MERLSIISSKWHHEENLTSGTSLIEEYDALSEQAKEKRRKAYDLSCQAKAKRALKKDCVPLLTLDKCEKLIQNHNIKTKALKLIMSKCIININKTKKEIDDILTWCLSAIIESQSTPGKEYDVTIIFRDGTPIEWECNCTYHRDSQLKNNNWICKHCYSVILASSEEGKNSIDKYKEKQDTENATNEE